MPRLRQEDGEERQYERRQDALKVHWMRGELDAEADNAAKRLDEFLGWLLLRRRMADMPGGGRTFRRRTAELWSIWPMPPKVEGPRRVIHLDGIRLGGRACVPIAYDEEHVLGWHLRRSENCRAWSVDAVHPPRPRWPSPTAATAWPG